MDESTGLNPGLFSLESRMLDMFELTVQIKNRTPF